MKKNVIYLFALFLGVVLSAGSAFGYALNFDADAGGANKVVETIYGWDLEGQKEEVVAGVARDIATHQSFGADNILGNGDTFTEDFTLNVQNGTGGTGAAMVAGVETGDGGYYNFPPRAGLYLDVSIGGSIAGYSNGGDGDTTIANFATNLLNDSYTTNFTGGSARLYVDGNGNKDFDGGETIVADFSLAAAAPFIIVPTVFTGTGGTISFEFRFDSINLAYFSQAPGFADPSTLIGNKWLFTMAQGSLALNSLGVNPPNEMLLGWEETGLDARFTTVPEPTTIFLLGLGLVGVAGVARKRTRK